MKSLRFPPIPAPVPAVRPKLLDRQALERVLARAAELQGAGAIPESSDLISESQLLEIGSEVGIGSAMLNQALAEERTRVTVPEERGSGSADRRRELRHGDENRFGNSARSPRRDRHVDAAR